jgi:hypothetical protein
MLWRQEIVTGKKIFPDFHLKVPKKIKISMYAFFNV